MWPANAAGGLAIKVLPKASLLFDAERIFYSQIKPIANPDFPIQAPLGAGNGPEFAGHDATAWKLGFSYTVSPGVTLPLATTTRASHSMAATFFNLPAPAVAQQHLTAGATPGLANGSGSTLPARPPSALGGESKRKRRWEFVYAAGAPGAAPALQI